LEMSLRYEEFCAMAMELATTMPSMFTWITPKSVQLGYLVSPKSYLTISLDPPSFSSQTHSVYLKEQNLEQELEQVPELDSHTDSFLDAKAATTTNSLTYEIQFHVVYSTTFRVPLLLFHLCHLDGSVVDVDETVQVLSSGNRQSGLTSLFKANPWNFLSQLEHPVLSVPFMGIHPCQTSRLMHSILKSLGLNSSDSPPPLPDSLLSLSVSLSLPSPWSTDRSYLSSWLSLYGSVVGLHIPSKLLVKAQSVKI